jgi:hypothetical protein
MVLARHTSFHMPAYSLPVARTRKGIRKTGSKGRFVAGEVIGCLLCLHLRNHVSMPTRKGFTDPRNRVWVLQLAADRADKLLEFRLHGQRCGRLHEVLAGTKPTLGILETTNKIPTGEQDLLQPVGKCINRVES